MQVTTIESLDDPRLDDYAHLTEVQLRCRLEPEKGIFIAESPTVIGRALDASCETKSFLMEEGQLETAAPLVAQAEAIAGRAVPVFTGPRTVLAGLTGYTLTRGILASMRRPALPTPEELVERLDARRIAVLEGIVDHTNIGAIFRSAAALDADAVLVAPNCCDPLYRRAARVSMGTVFQVPWTRIGNDIGEWRRDGLERLGALGFTTCAMALEVDAISLDDPRLKTPERLAVLFGTEGTGLLDSTIAACDYTVRIPMAHGVDSLNVAASSAVTFWELFR